MFRIPAHLSTTAGTVTPGLRDLHARAYAQQRAIDTREPYLVTHMGHVLWAEPSNVALAERHLGGVAAVY